MSLGFKLIIPGALALYLASACQPDFAALSAEYSANGVTAGFAGMESVGDGGSGNQSSGGRAAAAAGEPTAAVAMPRPRPAKT